MTLLEHAKKLFEKLKKIRRQIHKSPESGFDLPNTTALIKSVLDEYNIKYEHLDDTYAIVGSLGDSKKGKTVLLRADMDAVNVNEESGLDFAAKNSKAHLCGHDIHTTSLIATLIMLKERESELNGEVRFLFQPAEETLNGGKLMLEKGLLDTKIDAGLALHMWPNGEKMGIIVQKKQVLASALNFRIEIQGKGAHGAMPYNGIDPVIVASEIIGAFNIMVAHELPSNKSASVSIGNISTPGGNVNVIPSKVILEGTARSLFNESAKHVEKRLPEIASHIAKAYRASSNFEILASVPALVNTAEMSEMVFDSAQKILGSDYDVKYSEPELASEDYAHIASELPESCYFFVSCPLPNELNQIYPVHNPHVRFNEEALIIGPATLAQAAMDFLSK
ncbi:M20 metallopeptidase family protein [Mycoplasma tauri]|uniref:M20 metallopeptidase family protein n=1 Tax=Mycoplasma tauri TaxID=547987 RepID=UPI001CBAA412|nr:M20 family metallopeptidase [Mycoplasma tauri]MBZ4204238.1 amidohydrolase [Mycoplasma tauri]